MYGCLRRGVQVVHSSAPGRIQTCDTSSCTDGRRRLHEQAAGAVDGHITTTMGGPALRRGECDEVHLACIRDGIADGWLEENGL